MSKPRRSPIQCSICRATLASTPIDEHQKTLACMKAGVLREFTDRCHLANDGFTYFATAILSDAVFAKSYPSLIKVAVVPRGSVTKAAEVGMLVPNWVNVVTRTFVAFNTSTKERERCFRLVMDLAVDRPHFRSGFEAAIALMDQPPDYLGSVLPILEALVQAEGLELVGQRPERQG